MQISINNGIPSITKLLTLCLGLWFVQVNAAEPEIEEMQVTGQRTTITLRNEIRLSEQKMFSTFNDLNSTDDYDVTCGYETPTGSKLPVWQCDADYIKRARRTNVYEFMNYGTALKTEKEIWDEHHHKADALNAEMKALAYEHPELAQAMLELQAKKLKLEEMENQRKANTGSFFRRLLGKNKEE